MSSDAAVFYSAPADPTAIELRQQFPQSRSSRAHPCTVSSSQKLRPTKMDRQDSGFAENIAYIPSHVRTSSRPSSKSSSHNPRSSLNSCRKSSSRSKDISGHSSSGSSSTSRSTPKRSSKSPRTSTSLSRANPSSRHRHSQSLSSQPPYQFFHFPSLSDDLPQEASDSATNPPPPPPPPATIHYWTSDQTRRLEYAAIDAARKGIRGFVVRCIPHCFLPVEKRGTRLCEEDMRERNDDAASVRRYRLVMEDDIENEMKGENMEQKKWPVKEDRRRWSSFIRREG